MDRTRDIVKLLEKQSGARSVTKVFEDFVRVAALSIEGALTLDRELRKEIDREHQAILGQYDSAEPAKEFLALVVAQLHDRHEEFLGSVHEELGASNVRNGQFFTPVTVARMCARVTCGKPEGYRPGQVVRVSDPACGASVMLIEEAEALIDAGVRQADVFMDAGDIDLRACDISYVELSLLGYAAVVRHHDALAVKDLSRPRVTPGYFLHAFPLRGFHHGRASA